MSFALLELLPAILIAFVLGLSVGWFIWRWRRRPISSLDWNELADGATKAQSDLASAQAANSELTNERSALARLVETRNGELNALNGEVAKREAKILNLQADLDKAKAKIAGLRERSGREEN